MKIVHLAPGVGQLAYGVGSVVIGLSNSQLNRGLDVECWSLDHSDELDRISGIHCTPRSILRGFKPLYSKKIGFSPSLERYAKKSSIDLIHQHMIWMATSRVPALVKRKNSNCRSLVAVHGALDEWAINQSRMKKVIARILYENKNLQSADCFHATSVTEVTDFQRLRLNKAIALIENGVPDSWLLRRGNGDRFREENAIDHGSRILLYISRLTEKKNLPFLINVLQNSHKFKKCDWRLVIVGDWVSEYGRELRKYIESLDIKSSVSMLDPLWGEAKEDAFAAAECVVLPSVSEGNPMILMESLAKGVPILVGRSNVCPAMQVTDCGWEFGGSLEDAIGLVESIFATSEVEFRAKGEAGRSYIANNRTWSHIASQTIVLYEWLLGGGAKPPFVV